MWTSRLSRALRTTWRKVKTVHRRVRRKITGARYKLSMFYYRKVTHPVRKARHRASRKFRKRVVIPILIRTIKVHIPPSPCPHLIRSNDVPSASEAKLIRDVIARVEPDIQRLEERFDLRLEKDKPEEEDFGLKFAPPKEKKKLSRRQKIANFRLWRLRKFVDEHKAMLHPIRRLPADILLDIFHLCGNPDFESRYRRYPSQPWTLAHVNRFWRQTALSSKRLWASFLIPFEDDTPSTHVEHLKVLIARSGGLPLKILMDFSYRSKNRPLTASHPLIALLVQCSPQWGHVSFSRVCPHTLAAFRGVAGRLDKLEQLDVHISQRFRRNHPPDPVLDQFSVAPLLTNVTVSSLRAVDITLPWNQLTQYQHQQPSRTILGQFLQTSEATKILTHLTMLLQDEYACRPLTLPNLLHLKLYQSYSGFTNVLPMLDSLTCPALQTLRLTANVSTFPDDPVQGQDIIDATTRFITRAGIFSPLQELYIKAGCPQPVSIAALVSSVPGLKQLCVIQPCEEDMRKFVFDEEANPDPYLPLLTSLAFRLLKEHQEGAIPVLRDICRTRCLVDVGTEGSEKEAKQVDPPANSDVKHTDTASTLNAVGALSPAPSSSTNTPASETTLNAPPLAPPPQVEPHPCQNLTSLTLFTAEETARGPLLGALEAWPHTPTTHRLTELLSALNVAIPGCATMYRFTLPSGMWLDPRAGERLNAIVEELEGIIGDPSAAGAQAAGAEVERKGEEKGKGGHGHGPEGLFKDILMSNIHYAIRYSRWADWPAYTAMRHGKLSRRLQLLGNRIEKLVLEHSDERYWFPDMRGGLRYLPKGSPARKMKQISEFPHKDRSDIFVYGPL